MTEPLQVGQFAIVDHEPVDRGPNAGVFHGKGPADDRAELYILAEGTTPAGEAFAGHVVSALGNAFNALDMSLTGSLMKLFEEAERNLRDWNRKSIAQHRVSIGLTAFGRRGDQAVVAQAGPSAVFHLHDGSVTAYFTDEEHGRPIGAGPANTQLTRLNFAPGDRLLLLSTPALRVIDEEMVSGILALPLDQVLADLYHRLKDVRHLTAVLVTGPAPEAEPRALPAPEPETEFVIDATATAALPAAVAAPLASTFQPSLFIDDESEDAVFSARRQLLEVTPRRLFGAVAPAVVTDIPAPLLRVSGDNTLARIAAERRARAAVSHAALLGPGARTVAARPAWHAPHTPAPEMSMGSGDGRRRQRGSFTRGLIRDEVPARPAPAAEALPLVDDLAAEHRARATVLSGPVSSTIAGENAASLNQGGSLVRMRGSMGSRWKTGNSFNRRPAATSALPPTWLVIVVGLGILLTLVGLVTVPRMLDEQAGARYADLVDEARQKVTIANVQQDSNQKRKALTEAQAKLLEANELQQDGPEAKQLIDEVAGALAVMDAVRTPSAVDIVASLDQFGDKPVAPSRLSIGNDQAYILDAASAQVIAVTLANGERKVVFGEDKEARRGRPVSTAYLDASDSGSPVLLIADSNRALWSYSAANGLKQLNFNAPSGLTINDVATSGRDLYVLDANQSTVYRFAQADGGFAQAPTKVLETPDLAAARRLTVDGEIVTADADGSIHRFSGQLALELSAAGIDKQLLKDESPQALSRNGDLAILDAANERIVVLRRDGGFDRQYRHKDFRAAGAFAVRNGTAYVFSEGKLRRITW